MQLQVSVDTTQTETGILVLISGRVFELNNQSVSNAVISIQEIEKIDSNNYAQDLPTAHTNTAGLFQNSFIEHPAFSTYKTLPPCAATGYYPDFTIFIVANKQDYDPARLTVTPDLPPDFSIQCSATTALRQSTGSIMAQGRTSTLTVTILSLRGFNQQVNLTTINPPIDVDVRFTPSSVLPNGEAIATITVAKSVPLGDYTLTFSAVSGRMRRNVTVQISVVPSAIRSIVTAMPGGAWTVMRGTTAICTINVTSVGSFSSPVPLQVSGLPFNSTGNLSPALLTPPAGGTATSTFTLSTGWNTPVGSYNLTIIGTSGTWNITVTLFVAPETGDYIIFTNPAAPSPLVIQAGQCGNYSITVSPVGNFTAPVRLTLVNATGQVNWQLLSNGTVALGGGIESFYLLRVCVKDGSMPGNYTMTVLGRQARGLEITHTDDVLLTIPAPSVQALPWVVPLVCLLLGLVIGLLVLHMSRRRNPKTSYPQLGPLAELS
jgi:hypothetical protein